MSTQISCNGADRENRMLQLYEELQLLPAELARLFILREIEQTLEFRACVKFSVIGNL